MRRAVLDFVDEVANEPFAGPDAARRRFIDVRLGVFVPGDKLFLEA
jgi:hypothetical protein